MKIRSGTFTDIPAIITLFQQSVLHATTRNYNKYQRQAWAARGANVARWGERVRTQHFLLAEQANQLRGFGAITSEGYLDTLFVHPFFLGEGIATLLLTELEAWASEKGTGKITTDASLTARPFFEKHKYTIVKEQQNWLEDVVLVNFRMEKTL